METSSIIAGAGKQTLLISTGGNINWNNFYVLNLCAFEPGGPFLGTSLKEITNYIYKDIYNKDVHWCGFYNSKSGDNYMVINIILIKYNLSSTIDYITIDTKNNDTSLHSWPKKDV